MTETWFKQRADIERMEVELDDLADEATARIRHFENAFQTCRTTLHVASTQLGALVWGRTAQDKRWGLVLMSLGDRTVVLDACRHVRILVAQQLDVIADAMVREMMQVLDNCKNPKPLQAPSEGDDADGDDE